MNSQIDGGPGETDGPPLPYFKAAETEAAGEANPEEQAPADDADNDPLRTPDPAELSHRLYNRLVSLQQRKEALEYQHQIETLVEELADPQAQEAAKQARREKEASLLAKKTARATRGVPDGTKSTIRAIGRLLARCEDAFEDLIEENQTARGTETRVKIALAAARLASAASSLGNCVSSNARANALLARTKTAAMNTRDEPAETSP